MQYGRFVATAVFALITARPAPGDDLAKRSEIAKSPDRLETTRSRPKAYGIEDYSVTLVPAIAFFPATSSEFYGTSGSYGRFGPLNTRQDFFAPLVLPEGVIIDYIGLNTLTDSPQAIGTALYRRFSSGTLEEVGTFSSTVHASFETDFNLLPLDFLYSGSGPLILRVEQGVFPTTQYFGAVEVWWKRTAPYVTSLPFPSFNDVPEDHPFYAFILALADSGITVGCGGGNFCPDDPLTRGQMAVFLGKALGLNFGRSGPPQ